MTHRFTIGEKYSGEVLFGGCGQMDTHIVEIVSRTKGYVYYKDSYGQIKRVRRQYLAKWGEFFQTSFDRFFAYAIEGK